MVADLAYALGMFLRGFCVSPAAMATISVPMNEKAACVMTAHQAKKRPLAP